MIFNKQLSENITLLYGELASWGYDDDDNEYPITYCLVFKFYGHIYEVITPFDLSFETGKPYSHYMGKDIECLLECDAVYFAPGWVDSNGCNLEYAAAKIYKKNNLHIINQNINNLKSIKS